MGDSQKVKIRGGKAAKPRPAAPLVPGENIREEEGPVRACVGRDRHKKKRASDPQRAAATSYRCCLPALTGFRGSWPCGTCPCRCGESPRNVGSYETLRTPDGSAHGARAPENAVKPPRSRVSRNSRAQTKRTNEKETIGSCKRPPSAKRACTGLPDVRIVISERSDNFLQ